MISKPQKPIEKPVPLSWAYKCPICGALREITQKRGDMLLLTYECLSEIDIDLSQGATVAKRMKCQGTKPGL